MATDPIKAHVYKVISDGIRALPDEATKEEVRREVERVARTILIPGVSVRVVDDPSWEAGFKVMLEHVGPIFQGSERQATTQRKPN